LLARYDILGDGHEAPRGGAAARRLIPVAAKEGAMPSARVTLLVLGSVLLPGCGHSSGGGSGGGQEATRELLPDEVRTVEPRPGETRTVEESEIYAVVGTRLLVQNPTRGLAVIDVSTPSRPALVTQLTTLVGKGGELYTSGDFAFVVFKESSVVVGQCEIASVRSATTTPLLVGRLNIPGRLVASRLIGQHIYAVTAQADRTWITSVSIADPIQFFVESQVSVPWASVEANVSSKTIYLAKRTTDVGVGTEIQAIGITTNGAVALRGALRLKGAPQGRFHMDESGTTLRVVTFTDRATGSNLYVIDVSDLDRMTVLGSIEGLAPGEDLHATRFVGDRAYVVTYEPVVRVVNLGSFGGDPLWVVSLSDPRRPRVLGELHVPGWSDYVFPRGDRLLAIGRGDLGARVALSLYDVADPQRPTELRTLEFGVPLASSDANTDFRGVRVIEAGVIGSTALVAIPFTNNMHTNGACSPEHHVQLVDLLVDDIALRGSAPQVGLVRRTLPVGGLLYAVTDKTVAAIDVSNRTTPAVPGSVVTGELGVEEKCTPVYLEQEEVILTGGGGACCVGRRSGEPVGLAPLVVVVVLTALARRRRTARPAARTFSSSDAITSASSQECPRSSSPWGKS
jgi:hypothetical protein